MQKIIQSQTHSKTQDMQRDYYLTQKKTLEVNPRHPLIKELLRFATSSPLLLSSSFPLPSSSLPPLFLSPPLSPAPPPRPSPPPPPQEG